MSMENLVLTFLGGLIAGVALGWEVARARAAQTIRYQRDVIDSLSRRVASQSELLTNRAERELLN